MKPLLCVIHPAGADTWASLVSTISELPRIKDIYPARFLARRLDRRGFLPQRDLERLPRDFERLPRDFDADRERDWDFLPRERDRDFLPRDLLPQLFDRDLNIADY